MKYSFPLETEVAVVNCSSSFLVVSALFIVLLLSSFYHAWVLSGVVSPLSWVKFGCPEVSDHFFMYGGSVSMCFREADLQTVIFIHLGIVYIFCT